MTAKLLWGLLTPFIGTAAGSACVFFMKKSIKESLRRALSGFAAGVMLAASVWSLLIPSIEGWKGVEFLSFIPAAVGFSLGIIFLLLLDMCAHRLYGRGSTHRKRSAMTALAVVIHNIPEGMAVGAVFVPMLAHSPSFSYAAASAFSLGIAIQNFPEGAIISMPLRGEGAGKKKAFISGVLSGAVEPAAAVLTLLLSSVTLAALPYLLSFAAGAMIYVATVELIPEMTCDESPAGGILMFSAGFLIMMILDVALG